MATQIGVVTVVTGEVTATATDGTIRTLQVGDFVYSNELIATGPAAAVEIEFADGEVLDLGRSSQILLDSAVFDPEDELSTGIETQQVPEEVAAIQEAILAGEDPTETNEATAAGAGVVNTGGGHDAVFIDYLNPETIPDAGFQTTGVDSEVEDTEEEEPVIDLDEIEDDTPLTDDNDTVEELPDDDDSLPGDDDEPPVDDDEPPAEDDTPVVDVDADPLVFNVEEDGLSLEAGDNSEGNKAPGDTNADDEVSRDAGTLTALFNAGEDGPLSLSLSDNTTNLPTLYSNGTQLEYAVSDNQLTATAGEFTVFTLTVTEDGAFTFDLQDQIDHVDDGTNTQNQTLFTGEGNDPVAGIDFSSLLIATDSDGDTINNLAEGQFIINIEDDVPTVKVQQLEEPSMVTLDETVGERDGDPNADDETNTSMPGAIGYASVAGEELFNFSVNAGADGENTLARDYSLSLNFAADGEDEVSAGLFSHDGEIMLSYDGDDVIGHDGEAEVFRISMNADGDVTVTQFKAIDHGDLSTEGDAPILMNSGVLSGALTVVDNDGDETTSKAELGNLIEFEDDAPLAQGDKVNLLAGQSVEGNVFGNDTLSQDTPLSLTRIHFADTTYTFAADAQTDSVGSYIRIDTQNGLLKIYQNGDYTYTADALELIEVEVPDDSLSDWQSALGLFAFDGNLPMNNGELDTNNLNSNASLEFQPGAKGGLGVRSGQRSDSIDQNEALLISLGDRESTSATVGINNMNFGQVDQGMWQAFNADGEQVATGTFNGVSQSGKAFTINIETEEAFSYLSFGDNPDSNQSQGYFVSSFSYQTVADEAGDDTFTYYGKDADGTVTTADINFDVKVAGETSQDGDNVALDGSGALLLEAHDGDDVLFATNSNDILIGGDADDQMQGDVGDDTLVGGLGDDVMTGDEGADTFQWNENDNGNADEPAVDYVTDFNAGEDDVLDLRDLLDSDGSQTINENNLDEFLKATFDAESNQTKIDVYKNGDANTGGESTQSIMVSGDQQDLVSLLNNSNLTVDQT